jgi:ATP-dependent helicase HrpB
MTEGILTQRFLRDATLPGVGAVILDEFHERSIHTDLALAFLKELLQVREDLKVVVMSATLDAGAVSAFLGGCPMLDCPGRPFDVRVENLARPAERELPIQVAAAVRRLLGAADDDGGDVLAFLPGAPEIRKTRRYLSEHPLPGSPELQIVPLYGALPPAEQDRALARGTRRRLILATNIAETSLTVPGVTAVIDTGLCKRIQFDPRTGLDRLQLARISKQNATQRAGRAGRTAPGRVLRLWSEQEHQALPPAEDAEIRRVDLAAPLLQVLSFSAGDPHRFAFFEPPPEASLETSLALLRQVGALPAQGFALTERGRRLASLPVHPRIGAMLIRAGEQNLLPATALLAALLEERDILLGKEGATPPTVDSDLIWRVERFLEAERRGFPASASDLHPGGLRQVAKARDQLLRLARRLFPANPAAAPGESSDAGLRRLLLAGFPDRVCRRRTRGEPDGLMVGGRGVKLSARSGVREAELFLALDADAGGRGAHSAALVHLASAVTLPDLQAECAHLLRIEQGARFDSERGAVIGLRRTLFGDLPLIEQTGVRVEPAVLAGILAEEAGQRFSEVFVPDERARQLQARILLAARVLPEQEWPEVSDQALRGWLPEVCRGMQRLEEIARADWAAALDRRLSAAQRSLLRKELPERWTAPSGSPHRIDYLPALQPGGSPILPVKLQEVFGLADTPRIARGRVPVLLQLLSPSQRPVQVTADLRSFWKNGYPQVRKELRARYPRHPWPEDPWTAPPTARPKKKKEC